MAEHPPAAPARRYYSGDHSQVAEAAQNPEELAESKPAKTDNRPYTE
jgi:hypothetical protein